jgi:hypothetical protein
MVLGKTVKVCAGVWSVVHRSVVLGHWMHRYVSGERASGGACARVFFLREHMFLWHCCDHAHMMFVWLFRVASTRDVFVALL